MCTVHFDIGGHVKLSLRFFYREISERIPDAVMQTPVTSNPGFSSLSVLKPGLLEGHDIIYVDLDPTLSVDEMHGISVITTSARADLFKSCSRIVVPDGSDMLELLGTVSSIFSEFSDWLETLYLAVARDECLQNIIEIVSMVERNPMYIADASVKTIASYDAGTYMATSPTWNYKARYGYLPFSIMQNLVDTGELDLMKKDGNAILIPDSKCFPNPYVSKSICQDGRYCGNFFIIQYYNRLDARDMEIADLVGDLLSNASLFKNTYIESNAFYSVRFMQDMISNQHTDEEVVRGQLKLIGWNPVGDFVLFLVDMRQDSLAVRNNFMAMLNISIGAHCLVYEGKVLAVVNDYSPRRDKVERTVEQMSHDYNRPGTMSEPFADFMELKLYYAQALFVLENACFIPGDIHLQRYESCFTQHLCQLTAGAIPKYSQATKLHDYDEAHGTEFCHTLYVWLQCCCNTTETAERLYIHRNTVITRLDRIRAMVSCNIDSYEIQRRIMHSLNGFYADIKKP